MFRHRPLMELQTQSIRVLRAGFISIDCGLAPGEDYTDRTNRRNIRYTSDERYVNTGEARGVASSFATNSRLGQRYKQLRSFPDGTRNCYTLTPVERGKKYLVRADFLYGNYDGLDRPPAFDLYLGVNLWRRVSIVDPEPPPFWTEIVTVAPSNSLSVCLVRTGLGVPFVSVIELRPLPDELYPLANATQSLVLSEIRTNFGTNRTGSPGSRYPDDPYDRLWTAPDDNPVGWINVTTGSDVANTGTATNFRPPMIVMQTAVTTAAVSSSLEWSTAPSGLDGEIHMFLHFAELTPLAANETREMEVYLDGRRRNEGFRPGYLASGQVAVAADQPGSLVRHNLSIRATSRSTLPPILNALEVYALSRHLALPTDSRDVDAIMGMKQAYAIERNWRGDPCSPQALIWDGLNCTGDNITSPRITSLNLASSGLSGQVPTSVVNLTSLQILDLSQNNLTGVIPEFLAELTSLHTLNLAGNQFSGLVPKLLYERSQNGSLSLSIEGNPDLCYSIDSCQRRRRRKQFYIPIIIAISTTVMVLLAIWIFSWVFKRRRQQSRPVADAMETPSEEGGSIHLLKQKDQESQQFTYREIEEITSHFEKEIGKGGFGPVFYGRLKDRTQVAVKMLAKLSSQGCLLRSNNEDVTLLISVTSQVLTLMRVHHRNLVSLLGYCDEKNNLALVYEYMAEGCLVDHLRGKARESTGGLTWEMRLQIALEAAIGLEYLHYGCKPPIVHRDVKTANILLNQNLEAKIADFGLSRAFTNDNHSHISTNNVAGTLGYLDPEYQRTFRLNEKSDVFSFGVVLLELITGKPPIIRENENAVHIVHWVRSWIERGDIDSIVDPSFEGEYDQNSIWRVLEVALSCTHLTSNKRATMNHVVVQLKECTAYISAKSTYGHSTQDDHILSFQVEFDVVASPAAR
ncbi:hypothetical protein Taro_017952 [Colocasia esculenta]|uniref:non-specific serine/threonine protein kinase n=1 Tax=Colocasia esculenta TaxID=4460 RepID=A0A843UUR7_COLES|nr:hypothetical protein [Colocasia esculenta]